MHHAILAHLKVDEVDRVLAVVDEVGRRHGVTMQLFDADAVYNARHLESAVFHAERAFQQGTNATKTLATETLLYVTGERRVETALAKAGLRPGVERVVMLAIGYRGGKAIWDVLDRLGASKVPTGFQPNPRALERLGITAPEASAEAAVLERVALLDVRK